MNNYTDKINKLITDNKIDISYIYNYNDMLCYLESIKGKTIASDIETPDFSALNSNSRIISIGFAESENKVVVFDLKEMTDEQVKSLIEVYNKNVGISVFHNKYFDRYYSLAKYGIGLRCDFDTILGIHTCLIERKLQGKGMGLKELAIDYTPFGDYESELEEFKVYYCKENNIKKDQFTYDLLPTDLLLVYNGVDCIVTMIIYNRIQKYIKVLKEKRNWDKVEEMIQLKHDVLEEYILAKLRGVNVDRDMIYKLDLEFKEKRDLYKLALEQSPDIEKAKLKICKDSVRKSKKEIITKIKSLKKDLELSSFREDTVSLNRKLKNAVLKLEKVSSKEFINSLIDNTEFNFNSNKHKQVLFYDILKIEQKYFTKSKALATGKLVLDTFADSHEILKSFKQYGIYNKGIRAFLGTNNLDDEEIDDIELDEDVINTDNEEEIPSSKNSLLACISNNNKIYPSINITGTTTSRLSMSKMNLAQFPSSRSELGKIRKCIVPTKNYKFCYFDFAAMEVRLTAACTQEPTILEAINNNLDLHSMTALKVFGYKMKELDQSLPLKDKLNFIKSNYGNTYRYWAKSLIFSLLYGTTEHGLSKNLNITKEEAVNMINDFFKGYSKVKEFMDNNKKQMSSKGYVENLHGMRLNTPDCIGWTPKSKNYKAERQIRQGGNYLIQSLNATYIYKAIITFMKEVRERGLDIHLLFTIYDSLMVEAHESIPNDIIIDLFKRHFESSINGVKIEIDIDCGKVNESWFEIS